HSSEREPAWRAAALIPCSSRPRKLPYRLRVPASLRPGRSRLPTRYQNDILMPPLGRTPMNETKTPSLSGIPLAVLFVLLLAGSAALFFYGGANQIHAALATGIVVFVIVAFLSKGFFQVQPNQGQVMLLFGRYAGTARETGLRWANPFFARRAVSLRVRNFESSKLKVNDADGNPIEIAAVIVWQVVDTAEAVFKVDDYENYVHIQSESALRQMAQSYPYDSHEDGKPSLRSH